MDLFEALPYEQRWIDLPNGRLLWLDNFISSNEADELMSSLKLETPWTQERIQLLDVACYNRVCKLGTEINPIPTLA